MMFRRNAVGLACVVLVACSGSGTLEGGDAGALFTGDANTTTDAGAEAATPEASVWEGSTVAEGSTLEASSETADGGDSGSDANSNAISNDGASDSGAGPDAPLACSPFVTDVINVTYGTGAGFGQSAFPAVVKGPPRGGGTIGGSLHVLTLGNGGSIVVELGETIVDGPGPDFIVFENPFNIGSDPLNPFAEVATVEVSADGVTWSAFPCTATAYPWGSCAGWHPVFASNDNTIDPLDPAVAGGDPFDLADLPLDGRVSAARYVRITDRDDLPGDGFDLDAVAVVHGTCR